MGAAADCEAVGAGFFGQPINTLTTLGFVAAGIIVINLLIDVLYAVLDPRIRRGHR